MQKLSFFINNEKVDALTFEKRLDDETIIYLEKVLNEKVSKIDSIFYSMTKIAYMVLLELGHNKINDVYFRIEANDNVLHR